MRLSMGLLFAATTGLVMAGLIDSAHGAEAGTTVQRGEFAFVHAPVAEWVESIEIAAQWPADWDGTDDASWRNWLLDAQFDRRGDQPERYYDHAVEATTQALVAEAAKFSIDFDPAYQRLSIHRVAVRRDGAWVDRYDPARVTLARRESAFETDMATGDVSALIVVDDVRPGDVVRYTYSVRGENPLLAGMTHDEFVLAWGNPILERRVRIELPPGVEVATRIVGNAPAPQTSRSATGTSVRLLSRRIDAIATERDTPEWHAIHPRLQVAQQRSWADVVDWALPLYPTAPELPAELVSRVDAWRKLPDVDARVAAALQAVQEDVRYFSVLLGDSSHRPAPPATTWTRRFGDCKDKAWLLTALLNRLEVDAEPALVSMGRGRGIADALPAASQFDHVIVRARLGKRVLWLDPTRTEQRGPLDARQAPDYGVALPLVAGSRALVRVELGDQVLGRSRVSERFEPSADGDSLRFTIESVHSGRAAEYRRRDLRARGATEVARDFANYYRRLHGDLEVASPLDVVDDETTGELTLRETYVLTKPWANRTPGARAFDLRADTLDSYVALSGEVARRHPLWRPHPVELEQVSEFVLPAGWQVQAVPGNLQAGDDTFDYQREIARQDGRIVIRQTYQSRADHVPTARLAEHFDQRRSAADGLGLRLGMGLPVQAAKGERDRRLKGLLRDILRESDGTGKDDQP